MTFLNSSTKENYDAAFTEYSKAPDLAPYENEQKAGAFDNALGGLKAGLDTAQARGVAQFPSRREEALQRIQDLRPDPRTTGMVGHLLHGLADQLFTVAGEAYTLSPQAAAIGGGLSYAESQAGIHQKFEGIDPETARSMGAIEGGTLALGAVMPASLVGKPVVRVLSGAGMQAGFGAASRAMIQRTLLNNGYGEMAKQYDPWSIEALGMDAAFGGVFGLMGHGPAAKAPTIPPSVGDAALVHAENVHAEMTAPGVPADTAARNAHKTAFDSAVTQLMMGKSTDVEGILKDAGFIGKRPDFDALSLIRGELEKAGVTGAVERLRALEDEARARGIILESDTLPSVVTSDAPAEIKLGGHTLGESQVKIGKDYVPTELRLIEAGDVAATMSKADNQFRDRTRAASDQQIQSMAKSLDPALLGDAPVMDYGAPTLAADGTVVGGNGRAAAIARAYADGNAESYRASLGPAADGMQAPMLVRVLKQEVDIQQTAMLSNEGGGMRMSALEQAKVDGDRLGDFRAFQAAEDGRMDTAGNMPFIQAWVQNIPENQRAALMDADGRLSAEGSKRLQNAILYRAYGDSPVLSRLVESTDDGGRNIARALTRVAGTVADAREAIARGDLFPMDLSDDLVGAVETLEGIKRSGQSVSDWMKQLDAFGDGLSPEGRVLLQFMENNKRSSTVMADGISGFYDRLAQLGHPSQASMFEAAQPDKMHMLQRSLEDSAPRYSRRHEDNRTKKSEPAKMPDYIDVDGVKRSTTNSNGQPIAQTEQGLRNFWKWFGDSKVVDAEGKPLVVYHGRMIDDYSSSKIPSAKRGATLGELFLSDSADVASSYAETSTPHNTEENKKTAKKNSQYSPHVYPLFATVKAPLTEETSIFDVFDKSELIDTLSQYNSDFDYAEMWPDDQIDALIESTMADFVPEFAADSLPDNLKMIFGFAEEHPAYLQDIKNKFDGAIFNDNEAGGTTIVVFKQSQAKSAIGNSGEFDPNNPNINYSRGGISYGTRDQVITNFRAQFGRDADKLLIAGRVVVVDTVADLPGSGHPTDVGGMYYKGRSYIVASHTPASSVRGRVLHEVGVHAGMREMLGDELYQATLDKIEAKVASDPVFQAARALAESRANLPEHVPEETLAYLVENAPEHKLVRRVLASIRQWLYRVTGGRFVDLTQADLQAMAVASLRRYTREGADIRSDVPLYTEEPNQVKSAIGNSGEFDPNNPNILYSRDDHLTTSDFNPNPELLFNGDYSHKKGGDKIASSNVDDPTAMIPFDDKLISAADLMADAERGVVAAGELSKGFLPAVDCAMRVGQ